MMNKRRLALLLGAGFSIDAGLPLTSDLTKRFVKIAMNRNSILSLRKNLSPHIVDSFLEAISVLKINYEDILGWVQLSQHRFEHRASLQDFNTLRLGLIDLIYTLLLEHQVISHKSRSSWIKRYEGLKQLVAIHSPLRIFSLNHDMVIEDICEGLDINVQSGFGGDRKKINLTKEGTSTPLPFSIFPLEDMKKGKLNLLQDGKSGVNLYKVHGGLDFFSFRDESQFVRIFTGSVTEDINALVNLAKHLRIANVLGEIVVYDPARMMQFLRRAHVAGTYKFEPTKPQNLPEEWLKRFRADINYAEDLDIIGYGFADSHINLAIRSWLEHTSERKIKIINPFIEETPPGFRHFHKQITLLKIKTEEYFNTLS